MNSLKSELKAFAVATCEALAVRTQQELDAVIKPRFPARDIQKLCGELQQIPRVKQAYEDPEWDNIFAACVRVDLDYATSDNEHLLITVRLSQVMPIACLQWMVTNSRSAFAELDPPLVIIETYLGTVPSELENVVSGSRNVLRRHGYLTVELDDLAFTVTSFVRQESAWPITGPSFFFGWDFMGPNPER